MPLGNAWHLCYLRRARACIAPTLPQRVGTSCGAVQVDLRNRQREIVLTRDNADALIKLLDELLRTEGARVETIARIKALIDGLRAMTERVRQHRALAASPPLQRPPARPPAMGGLSNSRSVCSNWARSG